MTYHEALSIPDESPERPIARKIIYAETVRRDTFSRNHARQCDKCGRKSSTGIVIARFWQDEVNGTGFVAEELYVTPHGKGYKLLCGRCITGGQAELFE